MSLREKYLKNKQAPKDLQDAVVNLEIFKKDIEERVSKVEQTATEAKKVVERGISLAKGDRGQDGYSPDENIIATKVLSKLRIPKINEDELTDKILKKLPKPKQELKVLQQNIETDPMSVIDKILKMGDKFKLKAENIDGLEQTINAFRSQITSRGYIRGGGDTVTAGTNVTITTNANGVKVINASGGGGSGTVTTVSVVTANGISGSVANPTTTPAITLDISGLDATKIANGSVTNTEFQYLDGVTSSIQTQLDGKQPSGTYVTSVSGTTNRITSTGGTTPVIDISASYVGQSSITTLGTIATGVWNGTTIAIANGGTGQTTANNALNAFLPSQTGNSGKFLTTDGTNTSWASAGSSGITIGTTTITSGTNTRILYNNAGVVGEYTLTGTGTVVVMQNTPTLTTPVLGVATATSINKVAITAPATGATLTIIDGKTFTVNKTMSITSADDTGVYTFPTGTKTLVATDVTSLSSLTTIGTITSGGLGTGAVIGGVTMTLGSDANYDMYYRNSSGVLTRLANGTTGQILTATTGSAPSWASPAGGGITIGTTTITSGTNTRILYNNSGVVGEYTISGTGNVAMTTSPSFTTPTLGVASATSITVSNVNGVSVTENLARVYNNANISISNDSETVLTFNSERVDTNSLHSTSSNTSRLTVPTGGGGFYSIWAGVAWASNSTGQRIVRLRVNGTDTIAETALPAISGVVNRVTISTLYQLSAADYVEVYVYQNSGGSLNVESSANISPEFAMCKLSN